jgi:hypothetical protein
MATLRSKTASKSPVTTSPVKEVEESNVDLAQILREMKQQRSITIKDLLEALEAQNNHFKS